MRHVLAACLLVGLAASTAPASAGVRGGSGELRCTVAGGLGFIVAAQRGMTCVYYRRDGAVEFYTGSDARIGFDAAATNAVRLAYSVQGVDPSMPAALDGAFGGPGVGVTIGAGIGADVLVGGKAGTAVLMPIKNTSATGIDISAGLAIFTLHYAGMESRAVRARY